ncbi:MAG TPA: M20/M25/M40 family metallo-hydrolase [Dokdonella sp.]|uniref:M20/M25/M40 family metallo-hydrolase n=1 Tax=Dokdonella sp. TaxID=2291710 RepID=UPI002D7F5F71|nr:M20/M25/M40 family metallo-hydrolase [Dokdonella sp.]HET9031491.1 M20/M25/M40 family metallo-hydrolase [Dokdonella sp.]
MALILGIAGSVHAETAETSAIAEWTRTHQHTLLDEYEAFLRLPNLATDRIAIRRNADALMAMMQRRGLSPLLLENADRSAPPAVYGEWKAPGATRTLVIYAHYDGQAVDATEWASDPWTPVWRRGRLDVSPAIVKRDTSKPIDPDWRLYARSASDDKAGVFAILAATDALKAAGLVPNANIKFFFDGEEEQGSPHIGELLRLHRALLSADAWLICDGPVHLSGRRQLVFGVRGDANVDITVYGPKRPLHSGHYGNFAANPALRLAKLLASMKGEDGRVTIAGWYDGIVPLGADEKKALAAAPDDEAALLRDLGLMASEMRGVSLPESINLPSLNINGIRAADVGDQARNVIPVDARATLDLRLVKGDTVKGQLKRLLAHIRGQGYLVLDRAPTDAERASHAQIAKVTLVAGGYPASRTPMDLPIARDVAAAMRTLAGDSLLLTPTMGGSLPLYEITEITGAPTLVIPLANPDNNQHAENENLRVGHLWNGIATLAAVMRLPETATTRKPQASVVEQ